MRKTGDMRQYITEWLSKIDLTSNKLLDFHNHLRIFFNTNKLIEDVTVIIIDIIIYSNTFFCIFYLSCGFTVYTL